jgi:hypothetical protein
VTVQLFILALSEVFHELQYAAKIVFLKHSRVPCIENVAHLHNRTYFKFPHPNIKKISVQLFKQHNHSYLSNVELNINITSGSNTLD